MAQHLVSYLESKPQDVVVDARQIHVKIKNKKKELNMSKEIIDKDNPHKDIGKKKYRVRKEYTAWVEYDVIADSEDEAESAVMEHCGIEKIEWADGYHKGEPVEVYASDHNMDHSVNEDAKKIEECVPYEDNSTVDYSDPNWTSNEFEWLDEDYVNPNKEDKKDDMEVPF